MESRLLVAGSRNLYWTQRQYFHVFDNASYVFDTVFDLIISGGAQGVDQQAILWAKSKDYPTEEYLADWDKHGKRAGYLRNKLMVEACDAAILVWDGLSKGTKITLDLLQTSDKPYVLVGNI